MKRKQPKYSKGQTVYNSMLKGNYIISKKPDWNGFTYMYSFKDTDMSCGEMYLRLLPSTPVDEVKDKQEQTQQIKGQLFLDEGDFERTGEPNELYIRGELNDETFDVCNFGCNDTNFAKDYATSLVTRYNKAPALYRENKELKGVLARLVNRIENHWHSITSGGQDGILTALTKEAKQALSRIS